MNRKTGTSLLSILSRVLVLLFLTGGKATAGINTWTTHGPAGDSIGALAIDPTTPSILYAFSNQGLFKSTDSGSTWNFIHSDATPEASVRALAVDPARPGNLYAATNRAVFRSVNDGVSWTWASRGLPNFDVTALVISPGNPSTIYVGTNEYGCDGPCVFRSTDNGLSWRSSGMAQNPPDIAVLTVDPTRSATLYAGTFWNQGLYRTIDSGHTWSSVGLNGLAVFDLVIDPLAPATLYAGTSMGVFRSRDAGQNWTAVNAGLPGTGAIGALAIDPRNPANLYATTVVGLYRTRDGGNSWTAMSMEGLPGKSVNTLVIDPLNPARLFAATSEGVFEYTTGLGLCTPDVTTLCLSGNRFAVTARWTTASASGPGQAAALTEDAGYFTFFDSQNVEVVAKVLNGCAVNNRTWVFVTGLTNVGVVVTVVDRETGAVKAFENPNGTPFQPVLDTEAFSSCP
ncbi:MAG: hypothetical protein ABI592_02120 [Acidobacteriota bacterium]